MQKPNFTGTWKFNRGKSSLQIPPPDSSIFVVEHAEPAFRLSRTHVFGKKSDTITMDLTTDGNEVLIVLGNLHVRARCSWDGETLIFDSNLVQGNEEATNIVRYTLVDTHDAFVAEERFRSKNLNYDNVWVMERQ